MTPHRYHDSLHQSRLYPVQAAPAVTATPWGYTRSDGMAGHPTVLLAPRTAVTFPKIEIDIPPPRAPAPAQHSGSLLERIVSVAAPQLQTSAARERIQLYRQELSR